MKLNHHPIFLAFLIPFLSSCALLTQNTNTLTVLHYNILELDSTKIQGDQGHEQKKALSKFLKSLHEDVRPNVLSFNEMQYDLRGVPHDNYQTEGKNAQLFTEKHFPINEGPHGNSAEEKWSYSFDQANTGNKAKKYKSNYPTPHGPLPKNKRFYADQVNYGLFPGQYSTALATTFPILKKTVITKLKWKEFNPKINLSSFRDGRGKRLPKDMELFDKNFTDTVIDFYGKEVHLISLHTVPSYHFGNKKSPNYHRNRDQLRFLEWYLTGKTAISVKLNDIQPLPKGSTYVAVGDWNTDIQDQKNLGSKVLRRLAQTERLFPTEGVSFETGGFSKQVRRMLLDYIFHSPDLMMKEAMVHLPKEKRLFLGCGEESLSQKEEPGRVWVTAKNKDGKLCHYTVSEKYFTAKKASDHFPLSATFVLKKNL